MEPDEKLDLCGVIEPYCFLQCKSTLAGMKPGTVLEIWLRDSQTLEDLTIILKRSGEIIVGSKTEGDRFRLWIRKGRIGCAGTPLLRTLCPQRKKEKKDV